VQRDHEKKRSAPGRETAWALDSAGPYSAPKTESRISALEAQTGRLRKFCGGNEVLMSNEGSPWADTVKVEVHRLCAQEEPETAPLDHCVSFKLSGRDTLEWKLAGKGYLNRAYSAGEFCLVSRGTPVWARWQKGGEFLVIAIPPAFAASVADAATPRRQIEFTNLWTFRDAEAEHLMKTMWYELKAGCPAGRLFGESLAIAFTAHLLRRYSAFSNKIERYRGGLSSAALRKVADYIQANLHEGLSLRLLAELTQLSSFHFAHVFKQSTGLAPHRYVLTQRIALAKTLLENTRLPLAEIAFRVGFASQAHLTVMFRKIVGCTPGSYRGSLGSRT
jgi:AraC family transcriptional regulator